MKEKIKNWVKGKKKLYYSYLLVRSFLSWKGWFRNYIWFHICAVGRVFKIPIFYEPYKNIEKLKDMHKGQRCFIIGNGPSLTVEDVEMLKGEYTIAVNRTYKLYEKTDWRPTYYAFMDPSVFLQSCDSMDFSDLCMENIFLNSRNRKQVVKKGFFNEKMVFICSSWLDHMFFYGSSKFHYSDNLLWGIYDAYSITHDCMNIAQYMGFKEIILLGVDNNFAGSKMHFFEEGMDYYEKIDFQAQMTQKALENGYKFMKKELEKRGVKVFNATRGGALEVFERVQLEDILSKKEKK